ncbi:MAG TPA: carbohydrate-binding protein [Gemmatimonadaceae bacterium]|nr:carbohydrate-binding protein [Gemmatimonadaceae bacterium]
MMNRAFRSTLFALAALALGGSSLPAQTPADSIAAWTATVESGTLVQKVAAAASLAQVPLSELPPATRSALTAELERVNNALLNDQPIEGATDLGSEDFGEYYLDLATTVAQFNTAEANRAMILSAGVSLGTERRAAELGDEAVPVLADMIDHHYEADGALETLGLAWFWSDSTGGSLSDASRLTIIRRLAEGTHSDSFDIRLGTESALAWIRDPAFLPLAGAFEAATVGPAPIVARLVRIEAIPALDSAAAPLTRVQRLVKTGRILHLLCGAPDHAPPSATCAALTAQLDSASDLLALNTLDEAVIHLNRLAASVGTAVSAGELTADDSIFIAGGAHEVASTVPAVAPWSPGVAYAVGDSASYNGLYYQCRQAHTAQVGWEPPNVYALWARIAAGQTWAPQVLYAVGDEVVYQGVRYRAIQAQQSQPGWEPPNVPALWARAP